MSAASPPTSATPQRHYKYVSEMTSEERLASLQEWAEEKRYVQPGDGGTLPWNGISGMNALVFGGAVQTDTRRGQSQSADRYAGQYDAPIGPPAYQVATNEEQQGKMKKKNAVSRWIEKRKERKASKRSASVPPYVP